MKPADIVYDVCRHYINDQTKVDEDLIKRVSGFHRARHLESLATCSCHFDWHRHTVDDFRFLRQIEAFFKKNVIFSDRNFCNENAQKSFLINDLCCAQTNKRLKPFVLGRSNAFQQQIFSMQRYISNVLGNLSDFIEELPYLVKVTSGASARCSRKESLPQLKLGMKIFCTRRSEKYLRALYHFYGFEQPKIIYTESNRVEFVPKNWKTDRTIACEPEGNLPLQLAFDNYVKRRLKRFRLNLRDQSANQRLARESSITDEFATVDFSAASDTISYNVVSWLLPPDWFDFLCDVRSSTHRGASRNGIYAKFSSMGNGATFCLETLIFAAACHACNSEKFLVYGDDVIIESKYYQDYVALTRFLGFSINMEKSYSQGPFRESCGGDYFNGTNVTPVYIRNIDSRKANLCHLVNTLRYLTFPGSELGKYLDNIVIKNKLPPVPFNEDTMSGIWIDPVMCKNLGILQNEKLALKKFPLHVMKAANFKKAFSLKWNVLSYKAYTPKYKTRSFNNTRGYYLWFLYRTGQTVFKGPWVSNQPFDPLQTSSVPIFQHAYVRKWVSWSDPTEAMPSHLTWDALMPSKNGWRVVA